MKMSGMICAALAGLVLIPFAWAGDSADQGPEIGKPAPGFELVGADGKTYKLDDYKDKIVVLEWFNKDCPVTRDFHDTMKALNKKYAEKGVVWLAIDSTNFHTQPDNTEYAKSASIPYPILADFDGAVGKAYHAKTTPHMFIVNKGALAYVGSATDKTKEKCFVGDALDALLAGHEIKVARTQPFGCSVKYKRG